MVYLVLFIGVLAVSFAAVFIRLADAPPLVIASSRLCIAALLLIPFTLKKILSERHQITIRIMLFMLLASLLLALHFGLWITSLSYTSITSSVMLTTSHPLFVAFISWFLWKEQLGRRRFAGILVAFSGVLLINYEALFMAQNTLSGNMMALFSGIAIGAYLLVSRQLREHISITSYLNIVYAMAGIMLLTTSLMLGYSFHGYSATTYLMILLLALVPQLIGHSAINFSLRLLPATLVSVAILGEPIGATALGYFILHETPSLMEITGGLLTLGGIFLVLKR